MNVLLCLALTVAPAQTIYQNSYAPRTLRVKVMVYNTDSPVQFAMVQVNDSAGGVRFLYTGADGYASFSNTPLGNTYVVATKTGYQAGSAYISWSGTTVIGVYVKSNP